MSGFLRPAKFGQNQPFNAALRHETPNIIRPEQELRVPLGLAVAAVFATFGIAGVLKSLYGYEWFGSPAQRCHDYCVSQGKEGDMLRVYPKTMTGARDGPRECQCH
ncbi:hypothetical protein LJR084_004400 [Variovorax sp. LjRoot84]|uniref:hypothetical protein n=1 Tax=Variovorax sp. LjRoot84 TaxID=3342340 RepID=UPI003ECEAC2D